MRSSRHVAVGAPRPALLASKERRWTFSYALSLVLHALLVLFFAVQVVESGTVSGSNSAESETLTVTTQSVEEHRVAQAAPSPAPTWSA